MKTIAEMLPWLTIWYKIIVIIIINNSNLSTKLAKTEIKNQLKLNRNIKK